MRSPLWRRVLQTLIWLLAITLLWITLRSIPLDGVWLTLKRLKPGQIALLTLVNVFVLFTLSGRWWWILRAMGISIAYPLLSLYRLAAFSLSYFTPGPQFGGEPLQVYLLRRRHGISGATAVAAVTLDKAIELLGNFTFLIFGVLVGVREQFYPGASGLPILYTACFLLIMPVILLASMWSGRKPLSAALQRLPEVLRVRNMRFARMTDAIQRTEQQISEFCCDRPQGLIGAMTFSLLTWIVLVGEYTLMSRYLGLTLDIWQAISVLTVARLAFITPLPGGIGVLEAGQVLALKALGYSSGQGLSLGLLIRGRDLAFGGLGLLLVWLFGRGEAGEGSGTGHIESQGSST
jgi:uncharacterized protein (TIRG00374 family)